MTLRAGNDTPDTFKPDLVQLNNYLASFSASEINVLRAHFSSDCSYPRYPAGIEKLLTLRALLSYDTYAQSVARKLQTWADTSQLDAHELLLDFVSYMIFVFNGPLLILDNPETAELDPKIDALPFDPYNVVKGLAQNMAANTSPFIGGTTYNANFLHFLIMNLPVQARVKIKKTFGMDLSLPDERMAAKQKRIDTAAVTTVADIVQLKENVLFRDGAWISSTVIIFPALKNGAPLDYTALKKHLSKMMLQCPDKPFEGVKRQKNIPQPTRLHGVRHLTCYYIGRQRWEFTDPEEVKVLFKYFFQDT